MYLTIHQPHSDTGNRGHIHCCRCRDACNRRTTHLLNWWISHNHTNAQKFPAYYYNGALSGHFSNNDLRWMTRFYRKDSLPHLPLHASKFDSMLLSSTATPPPVSRWLDTGEWDKPVFVGCSNCNDTCKFVSSDYCSKSFCLSGRNHLFGVACALSL